MKFAFGKPLSVLGLAVSLVGVIGSGCYSLPPICPAGTIGPYDNRDRKLVPSRDEDWICVVDIEPTPPPNPPNLDEYRPTDDTRFRDLPTTARAAIFLRSCDAGYFFKDFNITEIIDVTYGAVMTSIFEQAIIDHSNCFRNKANGCNAVQECLGIAITPTNEAFAPGCHGPVLMTRFATDSGPMYDVWRYCGLQISNSSDDVNLSCLQTPEPDCAKGSVTCTPDMLEPYCTNGPINCKYSPTDDRFIFRDSYPCVNYGLTCGIKDQVAMCMGDGAACIEPKPKNDRFFMDVRTGIACEDETTLLACVNGQESRVDCSKRGLKIKCIGGSRPHCGADFQCNYDGSNAPPICEGTLIHVCNAGVPMTFDCAELGFETCDPIRGACTPKSSANP